jgi:uncharacterized membrane protein YeaQ/YmgE (transglycosylase-associated protein family)
MNLTFILLFGIIVGIIAHLIDPRKNGSFFGPMIVGIFGSLAGSILATITFNVTNGGNLSILIISMLVSTLLLFISWVLKPLQGNS